MEKQVKEIYFTRYIDSNIRRVLHFAKEKPGNVDSQQFPSFKMVYLTANRFESLFIFCCLRYIDGCTYLLSVIFTFA